MKILSFEAENIKRLRAVAIQPDGNLVQITGRNEAGKSSVLDAIFWSLAGTRGHQPEPIRRGEDEARIKLDLGEVIVRRNFKRVKPKKDGDPERITTSITVETGEGARFPSPQRMLDGLLGSLSFDPLAFARMEPPAQFEALRKLVGIDTSEQERANKEDYDRRRDINRDAANARAAAGRIEVPEDAPTEPVTLGELRGRYEDAMRHNREIDEAARSRADAGHGIRRLRETADGIDAEAERLEADARAKRERANEVRATADQQQAELDERPALGETVDLAPLRSAMDQAEATNAAVHQVRERQRHTEEAERLEAESASLTKAMDDRREAIRKSIEEADMPVEGLSLEDGAVTLHGLPFEQASDAQKLRVSCAIAMRGAHKLRVIRVRDGSLLDEDSLQVLSEMAGEADYQVWIERVDSSGQVGFVIEDGMLLGEAGQPMGERGAGDPATSTGGLFG